MECMQVKYIKSNLAVINGVMIPNISENRSPQVSCVVPWSTLQHISRRIALTLGAPGEVVFDVAAGEIPGESSNP